MLTIEPLIDEAERYLAEGDLDRAALLFATAHKLNQGLSELPEVGLARVAVLRQRLDDARSILVAVRRRHPRSGPAAMVWAVLEGLTKSALSALPAFEDAAALVPQIWLAQLNLGRALASLHRWHAAVETLERARALAPTEPSVYPPLCEAYAAAGDLEASVRVGAEGVAHVPNNLSVTITLIDALAASGREGYAEELAGQAAVRFPRAGGVASRQAGLALRRRDADGARRALRRQVELEPKAFEAWLLLGTVALGQLDVREAAECSVKAAALEPDNRRPLLLMAQVLEVHGAKREALALYEVAAGRDPACWRARVNAAVLLLELSDSQGPERATIHLEAALTFAPADARGLVQYNLALAGARRGASAAARAHATVAATSTTGALATKAMRLATQLGGVA